VVAFRKKAFYRYRKRYTKQLKSQEAIAWGKGMPIIAKGGLRRRRGTWGRYIPPPLKNRYRKC
jgi:hypothetical protein